MPAKINDGLTAVQRWRLRHPERAKASTLSALSQLNIELSSYCDKRTLCFMCGHQNDKIFPNLQRGFIDFVLLEKIRSQLEPGPIIQLHRDGDPLAYPRLKDALDLFAGFIISVVTHGESLVKRADEVIERCTTITVSVVPNDPDGDEQLAILREFLRIKGERKPNVNIKIVGAMAAERLGGYVKIGLPILHRSLHHSGGDFKYKGSIPVIPEVAICLDFLSHPSIDYRGNLYICNRLDINSTGCLGSLLESTLDALWNSPARKQMMTHHIAGRRDLANALCAKCTYWGVPTGG